MDSQTAYEIWAPRTSIWSVWAKPVLFAHLPRARVTLPSLTPIDVSWVPSVSQRCAIVVDLPGAESVAMGLALAELGYRPVPLFNACPPTPFANPETGTPLAIVDVDSILTALVEGCDRLRQLRFQLRLPNNAPPAFLLDSLRQQLAESVTEGSFDNRSVVFVTDFPSANFLIAQGIQTAILVRQSAQILERDLSYALQTWRREGIQLHATYLLNFQGVQPLVLPQTGFFSELWFRLLTGFNFRRSPLGGFGNFVPGSSGG